MEWWRRMREALRCSMASSHSAEALSCASHDRTWQMRTGGRGYSTTRLMAQRSGKGLRTANTARVRPPRSLARPGCLPVITLIVLVVASLLRAWSTAEVGRRSYSVDKLRPFGGAVFCMGASCALHASGLHARTAGQNGRS
eukprot:359722-Chlamydomonas_euryale.AAC.1